MPTITRQGPKKPRQKRKTGGVLDRIVPVSEIDDGFKLLIYGRGKTGKTRLACTFPKPLLLIGVAGLGTEKGTRSVVGIQGIDFVPLDSSEEIEELVKLDRYKSYTLDTAGGLQERVVNEFTGKEPGVRKDWRHVGKGDWGPINAKTMERLRPLLDLADFQGKHVVIVAHERSFVDTSEATDLVFPHVGAALTPGVAGWLNGACDYIGQTYIQEQMRTKTVKIGGERIEANTPTGKFEYRLRTGPHSVFMTGFRLPIGSTLPESIVNPSYTKIKALIDGKG